MTPSIPYAVISDQHFHDWSAFSHINSDGINSRLAMQLAELRRCADTLKKEGGKLIINAGDTFHQRGSLKPSILNPVIDLHKQLVDEGFTVFIISGNHDLQSQDTDRLTSSVTALEAAGCHLFHKTEVRHQVVMVPWFKDVSELRCELERIAGELGEAEASQTDLFIHAPVDGVIYGIPDHGITGVYLAGLGFKRVFSGHYHSHLEVYPGVYSIGASCHQTWSDVGTKAGFLLVYDDAVKRYASHAPNFVDIDENALDEEMLSVDGNYCRVKMGRATSSEVESAKQRALDNGALGVIVQAIKQGSVEEREASSAPIKHTSLEASVNDYVTAKYPTSLGLPGICADILSRVEAVDA